MFDENVEGASANQSRIVFRVLIEVESQSAGPFALHHFAGGLPDLSLDAASSNRTEDEPSSRTSILAVLKEGMETVHVDDGGDRGPTPCLAQLDDLLVEVHSRSIISRSTGQVNGCLPLLGGTNQSQTTFNSLDFKLGRRSYAAPAENCG